MTNLKTLSKALLGASALVAFTAVSAHAKTAAGTNVQNTFTLDYEVSGISQTQVNNTTSPTEFTVDRLVDLTVSANTPEVAVTPGATSQDLVFKVTNTGNDTHNYLLSLTDEAGDDFSAANNATIYYSTDGGVTESAYVAGTPPVLAPDAFLLVYVRSDIPLTTSDAEIDKWILVADTADGTTPVVADSDGTNTLTGAAENVLADGSGTSEENANEGDHSASAQYKVVSADLSGSKAVNVVSTDGTGCSSTSTTVTATTTDQYPVPGACVEYVISVTNNGATADADSIAVFDAVSSDLTVVVAAVGGDFADTSGSAPVTAVFDAATNEVDLTNGKLAAGETGYLIIRALVK